MSGYSDMNHLWYTRPVGESADSQPILTVRFYLSAAGREPVREWLLGLDRDARRIIGEDIKTAQYGWPLGTPVIRKLDLLKGQ